MKVNTDATTFLFAGRLVVLVATAFVCARATADPDLWGHLRFGLDLAQTGHLSLVDPYSFTQDVPWINHEWLSELVFAVAYRVGGVPGLLVLKTALLALAIGLLFAVARRADRSRRPWLLAVAIVGLAPSATTFRPQLWTILALAFLSYFFATENRARLVWLPLVFAVWANLHGGWMVGLASVALWICGRTIDTRSVRPHVPAVTALAVSVLATLLTPYGWRLWALLLSTVRVSGREVSDWRPLWQQDLSHGVLWGIAMAVFVLALFSNWRRMTWAATLPVAWLGINGLMVGRLAPLFGVIAVVATSEAWRPEAAIEPPAADLGATNRLGLIAIDAVVVASVWLTLAIDESKCLPFSGGSWTPDVAAASAFDDPAVSGRLIVPFDWGQYAIWHWGPRLRVSMDGRREFVFSAATIDLHTNGVEQGRPEGLEYLSRTRPEYVWLPFATAETVATWLTSNGYRLDVETSRSFIATRNDLPPLVPAPPKSPCFP